MSGSGPRAADEINLDEFERRLRAAGGGQARAEDPLAELARLVEFSHLGISNEDAPSRPRAEFAAPPADAATPLEKDAPRTTIEEEVEDLAPGASEAEREARQDYAFDAHHSDDASAAEPGAERRPLRWKVAVSALALAGLAMIGAVFALKGGAPGFKKDPPFIAAAQGPTKVAPPSDQSAAASTDAGASLLNNTVKPGAVKLVNSEETAGRFERAGLARQSVSGQSFPGDAQSAGGYRSGRAGAWERGGVRFARRHRQYAAHRAARPDAARDDAGLSRSQAGAHRLLAA